MATPPSTVLDERTLLAAVEAKAEAARPQVRLVRRLSRLSTWLGWLAFLIGAVVGLGWLLDVDRLIEPSARLPSMKLSTTLSMCGLGLTIALLGRPQPPVRVLRGVLAAIGISLGVGTLLEYATGTTVAFDNLLGLDTGNGPHPGRMAAATAAGHLCLWLAVLLIARRVLAAQLLATAGLALSGVTLVGYAYGVRSFYDFDTFSAISLQGAVALCLASSAVLLHRSGEGYLALVTGNTAGGIVVRRQLPLVIALPVVAGALIVRASDHGWIAVDASLAVFVIVLSCGGALIAWFQAARLRHIDLRRAGAEQAFGIAREALQAREALEADLRRANADLTDFSAAMAHDLRSPLTAIRGYAELLEDEVSEAGLPLLARIDSAAVRGTDLIGDILAFAQIGSHELRREPVDLSALVAAVRDEAVAESTRAAEISVAELPRISCDPVLVRVLVANLVGNALKYVPADRTAVIRVDAGPAPEGGVVLRISDNGDPIAADEGERIFEMFQRGSTVGDTVGSGVGLAICRRIAELHHGGIALEPSPGGGNCFAVHLAG